MSLNKWWAAQSLSLRPREIHLGFPFVGHEKALAVFDEEWLEGETRPEIDLERIKFPPEKRYFFSVNWRGRYVFEFLIPPAAIVFERRLERGKRGTHHVDVDLELKTLEAQLRVYRQAALHMHQNGLNVYLREDIDGVPLKIIDPRGGMTDG